MAKPTQQPVWRRSTRCPNGTCLEVARVGSEYLVRDSKHPEVAPLHFSVEEWGVFVAGIKDGEFDLD